ncbi:hypothetical protein ACVGWB_00970, partial [Enterobacter mori]
ETFFGHQVALGALGPVGAKPLDPLALLWGPSPAREKGYTQGVPINQRIEKNAVPGSVLFTKDAAAA